MLILKRQKTLFYGECKKNHAAHLGSHAVDGCGEYIPLASANLSDPASLMCAACRCHRNFHHLSYRSDNYGLTDEAEEEATASDVLKSSRGVVKRLRSNFSKEQKEEMVELAKKIGWSLKGREEGLVEEVCMRIGVEREVFRSWVHNHKKSFLASKSELITNTYAVAINDDGDGDDDGDKEQ